MFSAHTAIRRGAAVLLTAVVAAVLSGCVSIPTSGPVNQGIALNAGQGAANFEFNPEGPQKGATPQNILTGFVAAFTSASGSYAVAKQFLTPGFAATWNPRQSVQVRSGAPRVSEFSSTSISYSYDSIASVDASGAYREANQPQTMQFGFTKQNGQWRISAAPSGIVVPFEIFRRVFSQHEIYFFDLTSERVVPDVRWYPSGTAATRIVAALLAGPPLWLSKAVRTAFPDGTRLSDVGSVITIINGVARVDLTKEALLASPKERALMHLQLTASLSSVANISSVTMSVDGITLSVTEVTSDALQADTKVDSQPLVYSDGEFGFYGANKVAALPQLSAKVSALQPRAATLSSDGRTVAVLGTAGVSVVRVSTLLAKLLDPRAKLIAPSIDEYGFVWSVPANEPNALRVFDETDGVHNVFAGLPLDANIVSLEVSRDGARVAILLAAATGPRLIVAAIIRDAGNRLNPVSLGLPIVDTSVAGGAAVGATWVDALTVAVLLNTGNQSTVESFTIGGQRSNLGTSLPASRAIVGGNGLEGLRVLASDSTVFSYGNSTWQSNRATVDFIGTQR